MAVRVTFTATVDAVRPQAIAQRLVDPQACDRGMADVERAASRDGVFFYPCFTGTATLD